MFWVEGKIVKFASSVGVYKVCGYKVRLVDALSVTHRQCIILHPPFDWPPHVQEHESALKPFSGFS